MALPPTLHRPRSKCRDGCKKGTPLLSIPNKWGKIIHVGASVWVFLTGNSRLVSSNMVLTSALGKRCSLCTHGAGWNSPLFCLKASCSHIRTLSREPQWPGTCTCCPGGCRLSPAHWRSGVSAGALGRAGLCAAEGPGRASVRSSGYAPVWGDSDRDPPKKHPQEQAI